MNQAHDHDAAYVDLFICILSEQISHDGHVPGVLGVVLVPAVAAQVRLSENVLLLIDLKRKSKLLRQTFINHSPLLLPFCRDFAKVRPAVLPDLFCQISHKSCFLCRQICSANHYTSPTSFAARSVLPIITQVQLLLPPDPPSCRIQRPSVYPSPSHRRYISRWSWSENQHRPALPALCILLHFPGPDRLPR